MAKRKVPVKAWEAARLYAQSFDVRVVAIKMGVSTTLVRRWLRQVQNRKAEGL